MNLDAYLKRIDYRGGLELNPETLRALHRAHLLAIPYENLDIHLGRPLSLDEKAIFQKLVLEKRGGWCYEMNGLFAWALREAGFEPRLLAGAVNRDKIGGEAERNHLALLVELDSAYLVDVGFGNGFLEPLILREGTQRQGFLAYHLERLDNDWWRYRQNHAGPNYDFTLAPRLLEDFSEQCRHLQTSPDSGFVRLSVCQRFTPGAVLSLRGAVMQTVSAGGSSECVIETFEDYREAITEKFKLPLTNLEPLWERVWRGHLAWQAFLSAHVDTE